MTHFAADVAVALLAASRLAERSFSCVEKAAASPRITIIISIIWDASASSATDLVEDATEAHVDWLAKSYRGDTRPTRTLGRQEATSKAKDPLATSSAAQSLG